jgi:pimeloyl-ACP methyl ester carboxylesterase
VQAPKQYSVTTLLLLSVLLSACAHGPVAKTPMDTLSFQQGTTGNKTLIVFLPGVRDKPGAFANHQFVAAVRKRKLSIDMLAAHAHLGYLRQRTLVRRLKQDVIDPAKRRGYRHIWLVGNSLGGLSALLYGRKYPNDIDGIYLLGPFLGSSKIIREIEQAGGLSLWQPGPIAEQQRSRTLWAWLKNHRPHRGKPRIYLGFGSQDRFANGQRLLADVLPRGNVFRVPGKHRWTVWIKLWRKFLDKEIIQ